jgi:hypothetical protein
MCAWFFPKQENYKLQSAKSAVMSFNTNMENPGYNHTINNESIQKPDTIVHLGITINETSSAYVGAEHGMVPICIPIRCPLFGLAVDLCIAYISRC